MFRQVKLLQHCHVLDPEKLFHQKQRERFMRLYGQKWNGLSVDVSWSRWRWMSAVVDLVTERAQAHKACWTSWPLNASWVEFRVWFAADLQNLPNAWLRRPWSPLASCAEPNGREQAFARCLQTCSLPLTGSGFGFFDPPVRVNVANPEGTVWNALMSASFLRRPWRVEQCPGNVHWARSLGNHVWSYRPSTSWAFNSQPTPCSGKLSWALDDHISTISGRNLLFWVEFYDCWYAHRKKP